MQSDITLPRTIKIGADSVEELPAILVNNGLSRPLIVTDKVMVELGHAERLMHIMAKCGIHAEVFDATVPEPTASSIVAGVERIQKGDIDSIVALGGGSAIDSAKAIAILGKYGGEMSDYRYPRQVNEPGLPIIAIPTTAGTGAEVTKFTIITDEINNEKLLCCGTAFVPIAAIVDYRLTLSLPARVTADTGIDALTHAMEAYISRKANLYSGTQALAAMRLIGPNLKKVFYDGSDENAREKMMLGATLAGIAFSNASVALVHGMSRPIGAIFHVPHGLSNAMLLPTVTEWSIPYAIERYADCSRAIGAAKFNDNNVKANEKLIRFLQEVNIDLVVPTLAQFGANQGLFESSLDVMAQQALASGSPENNPRIPSKEEIVSLYRKLWL